MRKLAFKFLPFASLLLAAACAVACQQKSSAPLKNTNKLSASQPPAGGNLLKNATFDGNKTVHWGTSFSPTAGGLLTGTDNAACLKIDKGGENKWDVQLRHREMTLQRGHTYNYSFRIWSDQTTRAGLKVGMSGEPYLDYKTEQVEVTKESRTVKGGFVFKHPDDPTAEFAFHLGGNMLRDSTLPVTVCIDDVYLNDVQFTPEPAVELPPPPALRINQVGYFPSARKLANVVSSEKKPLIWQLLKGEDVVAEGKSEPLGTDAASGDDLHLIDFSGFQQPGDGYRLRVGKELSSSFKISTAIYSQLKYDALRYFYHNRSGIEIKMPHAQEKQWTRPAGHATSDKTVTCGNDFTCDYTLDVTGGWYDAGDHGKYVVNGGISVWTMMNHYERFEAYGDVTPFNDGKMGLPESGNGVPDILDEARWEMEFLLKMQVPPGKENAGMVHHKMHDASWSGLGLAPHEAEKQKRRILRPVSTAATLNLAATAAQAARIYQPFDPEFSAECLRAAKIAWEAAKRNPSLYASDADSANGGGPYGDDNVTDEFYWAASELAVTTRSPSFLSEMRKSPYFKRGSNSDITWRSTSALGTISLAVVKGPLQPEEKKMQQDLLVGAAERYLAAMKGEGYRVPLSQNPEGKFAWGSNSEVANRALVLALAYDFSQQDKYLEAVISALDYILGRNGLGQSYVTGYGDRPLLNPHHRFWAHQANPKYPKAPPGALSGGPNSSLQDPQAQSSGLAGCKPQKCFVDHIDAWSVNEITINWNAPFAWITAFLDENAQKAKLD